MTLALPRDELSVPVVRRTLARALEVLGVEQECAGDVELAITEACTNVLDHAVDGDDYEVAATITADRVIIEVIDNGDGFNAEPLGYSDADSGAEEGRGIQLMRALVDRIHFSSRSEDGTVVFLEKMLQWREGAPVRHLAKH